LDPFNISGTAEATNFKFGYQIDHKQYHHKHQNFVTWGVTWVM